MKRWWRLALVAPVLAVLLVACGGSGEPSATPTRAPTAAGFLPTPAGTPMPADAIDRGAIRCPPLPIQTCYERDNRVNVYRGLPMERAVALNVTQGDVERWVLDPALVQRVLRQFDSEVALEPYDRSRRNEPGQLELTVFWRSGEGLPWNSLPTDAIDFIIDADGGVIARPEIAAQWRMPAGFADLLLASLSDVTPTPTPDEDATPPVRSAGGILFDHPEGRLDWPGPDGRVYSLDEGHCGPSGDLKFVFGIPALIVVENDLGDDPGFWFSRAVLRQDGWRWTGYQYNDWQIWQGDDAWGVYLVHPDEQRFAFEYRVYGCQ